MWSELASRSSLLRAETAGGSSVVALPASPHLVTVTGLQGRARPAPAVFVHLRGVFPSEAVGEASLCVFFTPIPSTSL